MSRPKQKSLETKTPNKSGDQFTFTIRLTPNGFELARKQIDQLEERTKAEAS